MAPGSGLRTGSAARAAAVVAAACAFVLLLLSLWIVAPPFVAPLLPLAVGAPEVSGLLAAAAGILAAICGLEVRRSRIARAGAVAALVALAIAALPLVQFRSIARQAADERRTVTGDGTVAALDLRTLLTGFDAPPAVVTRGLSLGTRDGVPLEVDVYRPVSPSGLRPAIVQIYGGAWQRGAPGDDPRLTAALAARGYVIFAIDYRHAPRFRWPAQIDDVRAGLDWVAAHAGEYGADPTRLALLGRSAGGHLALMAAYTSPSPVKAVVSLYGPTDLVAGYRDPPSPDPLDVRAILETLTGGTPDDRPAIYRDASPITYATRPLPPTLQIHGSRDHIVLPRFAARLHERLRATGTTSLLVEIPWAEHAFDALPFGPSAQLAQFEIAEFLRWAMK